MVSSAHRKPRSIRGFLPRSVGNTLGERWNLSPSTDDI